MLLCLLNGRMQAVRMELLAQLRPATSVTVAMKRGMCLRASRAFKSARMTSRRVQLMGFRATGNAACLECGPPGRIRYLRNQAIDIRAHPQEIQVMAECSPAALRAVFTNDDSELLEY
jgi:hypothetical protein